jgi:CDP-diacylglycerol--serine O-phosphatidyltransferase
MVPPVIVAVVLMIALLVSYPWHLLTVGTLLYLALLPLGWFSYQRHKEADAAAASEKVAAALGDEVLPPQPTQSGDERPARLN